MCVQLCVCLVAVVCVHSSCGSRSPDHWLSTCGAQAQLFHGPWDLLRSEIEPLSPALAGGLLNSRPLGKPCYVVNGDKCVACPHEKLLSLGMIFWLGSTDHAPSGDGSFWALSFLAFRAQADGGTMVGDMMSYTLVSRGYISLVSF